jgi:hypothetical protein
MIARWHGDDLLIDQEAAATDRGLSKDTVRAKLAGLAVACDVKTRAPLYDHEHATTLLAAVRPRPARCAATQRARRAGRARTVAA